MRLVFFALFLFAAINFSASPASGLLAPENTNIILGAVIIIVVVGLALFYLLSQSLSMPQLEVWVRNEIRELIVSAIIVALVAGLFSAANPVNQALSILIGKKAATIGQEAAIFVEEMQTMLAKSYTHAMLASHHLTLRSGLSASLVPSPAFYLSPTYSYADFSGYGSFLVALSQAAQGIAMAMLMYSGIQFLLDFFLKTAPLLLPLAFVFRFIPFTRSLGSTIIALLIGVYIFFPFSIILVKELHNAINVPQPVISALAYSKMEIPAVLPTFICSDSAGSLTLRVLLGSFGEQGLAIPVCLLVALIPGAFPICYNTMTSLVYPLMVSAVNGGFSVYMYSISKALLSGEGIAINIIFTAITNFSTAVGNLIALTYIDSIIIVTITYIGTKSVSSVIGGEFFMAGIQKLTG